MSIERQADWLLQNSILHAVRTCGMASKSRYPHSLPYYTPSYLLNHLIGKFRPVDDYSTITNQKLDYEVNNCSHYFKGVNRDYKGISPSEKEIVERFHRLNSNYLPNNFSYYGSI